MRVLYVAGPYRSKDGPRGVKRNLFRAWEIALKLWHMGAAVINPMGNTANMDGPEFEDADLFIKGDLELIGRADAVVMLPGWEDSTGAKLERYHALEQGKPVYYWEDQQDQIQVFIDRG